MATYKALIERQSRTDECFAQLPTTTMANRKQMAVELSSAYSRFVNERFL